MSDFAPQHWEGAASGLVWDERMLRTLVANVPGAIYRCEMTRDWDMRFISAEIGRITGYPAEDFIDSRVRTYASVIHPQDRQHVEEVVEDCVGRGEPFVVEYRVVHRDGSERWVHEQGRAVAEADGSERFLDGAIFDISERKRLEQQIEHLAYHDALTDLPNRALFHDQVTLALARGRRSGLSAAVLFIDLDDFKAVNDSLGHAIGDQLLCEVASPRRCARRMSSLVRAETSSSCSSPTSRADPSRRPSGRRSGSRERSTLRSSSPTPNCTSAEASASARGAADRRPRRT